MFQIEPKHKNPNQNLKLKSLKTKPSRFFFETSQQKIKTLNPRTQQTKKKHQPKLNPSYSRTQKTHKKEPKQKSNCTPGYYSSKQMNNSPETLISDSVPIKRNLFPNRNYIKNFGEFF